LAHFCAFILYFIFLHSLLQIKTLQNTLPTLCQSTGWLSTLFLRPRFRRCSDKYTTRIPKWCLRSASRKLLSRLVPRHLLHPRRGGNAFILLTNRESPLAQQHDLKTVPTWPRVLRQQNAVLQECGILKSACAPSLGLAVMRLVGVGCPRTLLALVEPIVWGQENNNSNVKMRFFCVCGMVNRRAFPSR
jgi:hypothetical protein